MPVPPTSDATRLSERPVDAQYASTRVRRSDRQFMEATIGTLVPGNQGTIEPEPNQTLMGTNAPMSIERMLEMIDERVRVLGPSERKILLNNDLDLSTIKRIRNRRQIPGAAVIAQLEAALKVAPGVLYEMVADRKSAPAPIPLEQIFVRGEVQAGVWKSAVEWEPSEWFPITVPVDARYAGLPRYALLIRGDSMNRLYPDGTVVINVRFIDLLRSPESGERVVTLRRALTSDDYEATVKEYEFDPNLDRHLLWPRSTDPEFQTPIIIPANRFIRIEEGQEIPTDDLMMHLPQAGEPDVMISALVIGSYRPEGRIFR